MYSRPLSIYEIAFVLLVALASALLCAQRPNDADVRNDTHVYAKYYECLAASDPTYCNRKNPAGQFEWLSQWVFQAGAVLVDFETFKLVLAFCIFAPILFFVASFSPGGVLSLLLLLSSAKYWEMGSNVLRQGLATSLFYLGIVALLQRPLRAAVLIGLSSFFHNMMAAMMPVVTFNKRMFYRFPLLWGSAFLTAAFFLSLVVLQFLSGYSSKVAWYLKNTEAFSGYELGPIYFMIPVFAAVIYAFSTRANPRLNLLSILFFYIFSMFLLFQPLGAGYRYLVVALPLFVVLYAFFLDFIRQQFGKQGKLVGDLFFVLSMAISSLGIFLNDYYLIMKNLYPELYIAMQLTW